MLRRDAISEYTAGALWVWPAACGAIALAGGYVLAHVGVHPGSRLFFLAFQGTAEDARSLLITITGTVVTVIALVLGLTVVALQLSSTQFSPRLLRNFLRDRSTQLVLSVFIATFAYSAAGLYTVGVSAGNRVSDFPRLAVSGAMVLLFLSLAMVVFYANHLAHSIQIDAIAKKVERVTLGVIRELPTTPESPVSWTPPATAAAVLSTRSGYIQAMHVDELAELSRRTGVSLFFRLRSGDHIVAGTTLCWAWTGGSADPAPPIQQVRPAIEARIRVGFERTMEEDAAFGIRQLIDIACKALSPAVNDPYTAVQAIDHLSVVFCSLAVLPLGPIVSTDAATGASLVVPSRTFDEYLSTTCGLIRRYGASEPTVSVALLGLLANCAAVLPAGSDRGDLLRAQADVILTDAAREIANPGDVEPVRVAGRRLIDALK